jgi:hypothetical protein
MCGFTSVRLLVASLCLIRICYAINALEVYFVMLPCHHITHVRLVRYGGKMHTCESQVCISRTAHSLNHGLSWLRVLGGRAHMD